MEYSDKSAPVIGKILYYSMQDVIWYAGGNLNKMTARKEHFKYGKKYDLNYC